jgi:hypothetical protein
MQEEAGVANRFFFKGHMSSSMTIPALPLNIILFWLLAFLPSFMAVTLSQDSRTPGLLVAAIIVFLALLRKAPLIRVRVSWIIIIGLVFVWISILTPLAGDVSYSKKSLYSILIASFLLVFTFFMETWFERCDDRRLLRLVNITSASFILIGWVGVFFKFKALGYNQFPDAIFPFSEPAHFARIAGPIYFIAFFLATHKFKFIILVNALIQSILMQSLSLLFYSAMIFIIIIQLKKFRYTVIIALLLGAFFAFLFFNPVYLSYFESRLTLSRDSGNLTSLVMLQGAVAAKNSLIDSGGLGLGFQMLGTEDPNEISEIINRILSKGGELNRADGGFIAAKLIAELGLAGVVLAILTLVQIVWSGIWLRHYWKMYLKFKDNVDAHYKKLVIAHSFVTTFFIEMFLRGGGYFSLTVILFLVSVFYIRKSNDLSMRYLPN